VQADVKKWQKENFFLFVYFRSGCVHTLHKCLRSNKSHGLRAVCKVILIPQLILHTKQQQYVLCKRRKTEWGCKMLGCGCAETPRYEGFWGAWIKVSMYYSLAVRWRYLVSSSGGGGQCIHWSKSRPLQFAVKVDHNSGWDTNRRRPGITRACGLSLAKVIQTHTHTHTHAHKPQPEAATARFPDILQVKGRCSL
jgi:hypothetical protein